MGRMLCGLWLGLAGLVVGLLRRRRVVCVRPHCSLPALETGHRLMRGLLLVSVFVPLHINRIESLLKCNLLQTRPSRMHQRLRRWMYREDLFCWTPTYWRFQLKLLDQGRHPQLERP